MTCSTKYCNMDCRVLLRRHERPPGAIPPPPSSKAANPTPLHGGHDSVVFGRSPSTCAPTTESPSSSSYSRVFGHHRRADPHFCQATYSQAQNKRGKVTGISRSHQQAQNLCDTKHCNSILAILHFRAEKRIIISSPLYLRCFPGC